MIRLKPETERLLQEEIEKGGFRSLDEMLDKAIRALHAQSKPEPPTPNDRREAVEWALDFAQHRAIPLGDISIKDLIHEGHRL